MCIPHARCEQHHGATWPFLQVVSDSRSFSVSATDALCYHSRLVNVREEQHDKFLSFRRRRCILLLLLFCGFAGHRSPRWGANARRLQHHLRYRGHRFGLRDTKQAILESPIHASSIRVSQLPPHQIRSPGRLRSLLRMSQCLTADHVSQLLFNRTSRQQHIKML